MNPHVPRRIDLPTEVPLDTTVDLSVLDEAKIFAAPDDPALWPRWREQLHRLRTEARARIGYDGSRYDAETSPPFVVDVVWLWDELFYDHDHGTFTVEAYLDRRAPGQVVRAAAHAAPHPALDRGRVAHRGYKLLLAGAGINRSPSIGFRVACDLGERSKR